VVSTFRRIPARTWPPLEHFEGLLQWQQVEHSPETTLTTHQFELFWQAVTALVAQVGKQMKRSMLTTRSIFGYLWDTKPTRPFNRAFKVILQEASNRLTLPLYQPVQFFVPALRIRHVRHGNLSQRRCQLIVYLDWMTKSTHIHISPSRVACAISHKSNWKL